MFVMLKLAERIALNRVERQERRREAMPPQEPRVKIKSYTPLKFMCIECGAVFDASGTSGESLNADIERHMAEQHSSEDQAA